MQETTLKSSSPTMLVWSWWRQVQILVWRRGNFFSLLPFHVTSRFKVRMFATRSTLSVKRSGYFSHSSPQPWELTSLDTPTGQEVSNGDVQENGVDGFGDCDLEHPKGTATSSCSQRRPCRVTHLWDLFSFRPICNHIQYQWLSGMGKSM